MVVASINSFSGRIAASRARSPLCAAVVASATGTARPTPCGCVYLSDMPRHSLRGSLRFIPQKRISRGSSLLIFISQGSHTCCCDLPVLERAHAADPQATYDHTINLQRHTAFGRDHAGEDLSLIHISEPTRLGMISYAVFCLKKKKKK